METQTESTTEKAKVDVYQLITDRIMAKLEQGVVPWQQMWTVSGIPRNLVTKKPYSGINLLILASMGFERNYFLTFKQIKSLGGYVKQGEKSIPVIFWNWSEKEDEETKEMKKVSMIRYYLVFNVEQCEGLPEQKLSDINQPMELYSLENIEAILDDMPKKPRIVHKENRAYYHKTEDFINMPRMRAFKDAESYYGTLFHELVHSTGHASRLNRKEIVESTSFGTEPYSKEELVAEIGACFLKSHTGIDLKHFDNDVAYIQNWLAQLKNDKKLIIYASASAQKAVNYILNVTYTEPEPVENGVEEVEA